MGYCYCRPKRELNEYKCRRVVTNVHLKQRKATEEEEGDLLRKENLFSELD
jgi:hypothetical protein